MATQAISMVLTILLVRSVSGEHEQEADSKPQLVIDAGGFTAPVMDVAFSPDGKSLAAVGGKVVRIWDVGSGRLLRTLRGERAQTSFGDCLSVAYSPDGAFLLVGVDDTHKRGSIRVYRTSNLDEVHSLLAGHVAPCHQIAFHPDGRYMASIDANGKLLFWDWSQARPPTAPVTRVNLRGVDDRVRRLAFPSALPELVVIGRTLQILTVPKGEPTRPTFPALATLVKELSKPPLTGRVFQTRMAVAESGRLWVIAGESDDDFWLSARESNTFRFQPSVERSRYMQHRARVCAIAFDKLGELIASGDEFGDIHIWETTSGALKHHLRAEGRALVGLSALRDTLTLRATEHANHERHRNGSEESFAFSMLERSRLASTSSTNGRQQRSRIGDTEVTVTDEAVERREGGKLVARLQLPMVQPSTILVPQVPLLGVERPVVVGGSNGYLTLWDSANNNARRRYFYGHEDEITNIELITEKNILLTSSLDRTVKVWPVTDYQPTGEFDFDLQDTTVARVPPGSSAELAGLHVGDEIVRINGLSYSEMRVKELDGDLRFQPGQQISLDVRRRGQSLRFDVQLKEGFDIVRPLLTLFFTERGWIAWTPEGYFDASVGSQGLIGWHVNQGPAASAQYYQVQQFRKHLYRPEIISATWKTGRRVSAFEGKNLLNVAQRIESYAPPTVRFTQHYDGMRLRSDELTLTAEVTSPGSAIDSVTVKLNGAPIKTLEPTLSDQRHRMLLQIPVQLRGGENHISVVANNKFAYSSVQDNTIRVFAASPTPSKKPDVYAVVVGINNYPDLPRGPDGFDDLNYCKSDARAFEQQLKAQEHGRLYAKVHVTSLIGNTTRAQFVSALESMARKAKFPDVGIVYFAGHSNIEKQFGMRLLFHDSNLKDGATTMRWRELVNALQLDFRGGDRFLFLDTCHAKGAVMDARNPLHLLTSDEQGTILFASSELTQTSFELDEVRGGAFTHAFVQSLTPATDRDGDQRLNAEELSAQIYNRVRQLTDNKQSPVFIATDHQRNVDVLGLKSRLSRKNFVRRTSR